MLQLEQKLQHHMDCEDRRVKELTEGVLYDFLPAALNVMLPNCEDPLMELDPDRCRVRAAQAHSPITHILPWHRPLLASNQRRSVPTRIAPPLLARDLSQRA